METSYRKAKGSRARNNKKQLEVDVLVLHDNRGEWPLIAKVI